MQRKLKICSNCGEDKVIWKSEGREKYCKTCWLKIGKKSLKTYRRKETGELKLFKEIYEDRGRKCEITGEPLEFNVSCFAHILSKGAFPKYRLNPNNVMIVKQEIHFLYDNACKDQLLERYPGASVIYEKKEELKREYYN